MVHSSTAVAIPYTQPTHSRKACHAPTALKPQASTKPPTHLATAHDRPTRGSSCVPGAYLRCCSSLRPASGGVLVTAVFASLLSAWSPLKASARSLFLMVLQSSPVAPGTLQGSAAMAEDTAP
jgi:hypothetical protein